MADMRSYFGAVMLVVLATVFVATLFYQSVQNGYEATGHNANYTDTGQFPVAGQTESYMEQMNKSSVDLSKSMNSTLGASSNLDITGVIFGSASSSLGAMSIIWSAFMMVINMFSVLFLSPIAQTLGISTLVAGIGLAYMAGLVILVVAGVVFKWFI